MCKLCTGGKSDFMPAGFGMPFMLPVARAATRVGSAMASFLCSSPMEPELSIMKSMSTLSTPDCGTSSETPDTVHGVKGASS
jgi:hypothetical protein